MHRGLCNQQSPQASYQRGKISRSKCSKSAVLSWRRGAAGREGCSSGQQSTQELCWQSCCCGAVVAAAACRGAHSAGANVRRRGRSRVQRCLPPTQAQPTPWRWSGRCAIRPQASCSGNNSLRHRPPQQELCQHYSCVRCWPVLHPCHPEPPHRHDSTADLLLDAGQLADMQAQGSTRRQKAGKAVAATTTAATVCACVRLIAAGTHCGLCRPCISHS
jgi:hypothetical protein